MISVGKGFGADGRSIADFQKQLIRQVGLRNSAGIPFALDREVKKNE
jgi:hypothetical protein